MSKRLLKQWDNEAVFGSDILGVGACHGDIAGKVKTRQIGFVRYERKQSKRLLRKSGVPVKGRGKTGTAQDQ